MRSVVIAASIVFASLGPSSSILASARAQQVSRAIDSARQMGDGRQWTTENLALDVKPSYCFEDAESNCRRYGRLYTWESALRGCRALGEGWRLPTNDEWAQLAQHYGGLRDESDNNGTAAYKALVIGGSARFNALIGGNRSGAGEYARLEAHGLYWTASESAPMTAWFYNFGQNGLSVGRHRNGDKQMALSVRCVMGQ